MHWRLVLGGRILDRVAFDLVPVDLAMVGANARVWVLMASRLLRAVHREPSTG
jgi:hypothetical protein